MNASLDFCRIFPQNVLSVSLRDVKVMQLVRMHDREEKQCLFACTKQDGTRGNLRDNISARREPIRFRGDPSRRLVVTGQVLTLW